jgi:hypothetical protein
MSTNEENIDNTEQNDNTQESQSNEENTSTTNTTTTSSIDTINNQAIHVTGDTLQLISNILLSPYLLLVSSAMVVYLYIRENNNSSLFGFFSDFTIWTLFIVVITAHLLFQIYGVKLNNIIFNILNSGSDLAKTIFKIEDSEVEGEIVTDGENESDESTTTEETEETEETDGNEVFHIPGNYYNYQEAKELCSAYNARLANYDEIESAYQNGAEWCSYGWSKGQMAFFPTQKETYNKLQETENEKNNCGRPGINGGYMANPYIRFGVNCYGEKPKQSKRDELYMKAAAVPKYSRSNPNNNSFSSMLNKIIVSGFNYNKWNEVERI